jgi:hypothetical protein
MMVALVVGMVFGLRRRTVVYGTSGLVMANMGRTKKALPGDWSGARSDFRGRDKFPGFLFSLVFFRPNRRNHKFVTD